MSKLACQYNVQDCWSIQCPSLLVSTMSKSAGQYTVQVCWSVQCPSLLVSTQSKSAGEYNVQVYWSIQCPSLLVSTMSKSAGQYTVQVCWSVQCPSLLIVRAHLYDVQIKLERIAPDPGLVKSLQVQRTILTDELSLASEIAIGLCLFFTAEQWGEDGIKYR